MKLQHPTFDSIEQTVPDDEAGPWLAMGWIAADAATPTGDAAEDSKADTIEKDASTGDDQGSATPL